MDWIARSTRLAPRFSFRRASRKMRVAHGRERAIKSSRNPSAEFLARDVLLKGTASVSSLFFFSFFFPLLFPSIDYSVLCGRAMRRDRSSRAGTHVDMLKN